MSVSNGCGSTGDTKKEVLALLGCTDEAALHAMYSELIKNTELPLKIANKYLADDEFKVKQDFDKLLRVSSDWFIGRNLSNSIIQIF